MTPKSRARRLLPVIALLALPFFFYWKLFALNPDERRIFRGDFLNQHYVWKSYALERVKEGDLPLWNPHVLGGVAFHANPQVGLFYPPNYLLLPFVNDGRVSYIALETFQLLHQFLAGLGMWLFLTAIGLRSGAAWMAAVVYMFTGFFTTPGHHALVLTAAWIPMNLYLATRALESRGTKWMAASAMGMCLMLLAGHPQPAYYGILVVTAWAVYRAGWKKAARGYVPSLVLGIVLASVQLLPTYELASESNRKETGYDYATTFEFSPYFLAGAVVPRGQIPLPGQDDSAPLHLYVGIGGLLLAAVGWAASRRRERWFFIGLGVAALLLAVGSGSILFDWAYSFLPGFNRFRIPFRILGLYSLAMSALVGLGMDVLTSGVRRVRHRITLVARAACALVFLLAAWSAYVHTRLVVSPGALGPRQVERVVSSANWALILAVLSTMALFVFLWRGGRRWPAWALAAILVIDLGSFVKDRGLHPYRTLVRAEERPVHAWIGAQAYPSRYATGLNLESYSMLHGTESAGGQDSLVDGRYAELLSESETSANVLSLLNVKFLVQSGSISDVEWCGSRTTSLLPVIDIPPALTPLTLTFLPPMPVRHLRLFWSPLDRAAGDGNVDAVLRFPSLPPSPLIVSPWEARFDPPESLESLTVELEESSSPLRLERIETDGTPLELRSDFVGIGEIKVNLHTLPRAYFAVSQPEPRGTTPRPSFACWTPDEGVELIRPTTGETWTARLSPDVVEVVRHEPEVVVLESDSSHEGYVILSETYRPGWRAEVDGEERTALRAQSAFRGVAVPAGRHRIVWTYRPLSLTAGAALTLLGLVVVTILGAPRRGRRLS